VSVSVIVRVRVRLKKGQVMRMRASGRPGSCTYLKMESEGVWVWV